MMRPEFSSVSNDSTTHNGTVLRNEYAEPRPSSWSRNDCINSLGLRMVRSLTEGKNHLRCEDANNANI